MCLKQNAKLKGWIKVEDSWTENPFEIEARHIKVSLAKAMRTVREKEMPQNGTHDHRQHQWYYADETACQLWYWDFMALIEGEEVLRGVHLCMVITLTSGAIGVQRQNCIELLNPDFTYLHL